MPATARMRKTGTSRWMIQPDRMVTLVIGVGRRSVARRVVDRNTARMKHRVVAAVLFDGARVLLCHRHPQRSYFPGVWDFPGGHILAGEQPADALTRELREEVGVTICGAADRPLLVVREGELDMSVWLIRQWSGTPVNAAPDEHVAIAWFAPQQAAQLTLAHPTYPPVLAGL